MLNLPCVHNQGRELLSDAEEDEEDILDKAFDVRQEPPGLSVAYGARGLIECEITAKASTPTITSIPRRRTRARRNLLPLASALSLHRLCHDLKLDVSAHPLPRPARHQAFALTAPCKFEGPMVAVGVVARAARERDGRGRTSTTADRSVVAGPAEAPHIIRVLVPPQDLRVAVDDRQRLLAQVSRDLPGGVQRRASLYVAHRVHADHAHARAAAPRVPLRRPEATKPALVGAEVADVVPCKDHEPCLGAPLDHARDGGHHLKHS